MKDAAVAELMRSYTEPPRDAVPNWADVLCRADAGAAEPSRNGAPAAPRTRAPRSRLRIAVAVGLALAILLVPPAVAFHSQLVDLVLGEPAPEPVKAGFAAWDRIRSSPSSTTRAARTDLAQRFPGVDAARAEGVAELRTANGVVGLWQAPRSGGGQCWLFVFGIGSDGRGLNATGSCDAAASSGALEHPEWVSAAMLGNIVIVHARVHQGVNVRLEREDGSSAPMDVVAGHALAAVADATGLITLIATTAEGAESRRSLYLPQSSGTSVCSGICGSGGGDGVAMFTFGSGPTRG